MMTENNQNLRSLIEQSKGYLQLLEMMGGEEIFLVPVETPSESEETEETEEFMDTEEIKEESLDETIETLEELNEKYTNCPRCGLSENRTNVVMGEGNPKAKLMLIGEAPGRDEDETGRPFVGRAGKLLDKILAAIDLDREDVFITSILKCRPPENRDPKSDEIEACHPILMKQIELIQPAIILALGKFAGNTLLDSTSSLKNMRGKFYDYNGIKLIVTYHPAALLRNPNWKRPTWEDIKMMKKEYDAIESE